MLPFFRDTLYLQRTLNRPTLGLEICALRYNAIDMGLLVYPTSAQVKRRCRARFYSEMEIEIYSVHGLKVETLLGEKKMSCTTLW